MIEWSGGLRSRLLPDERDASDEELAEAEPVAVLEPDVWAVNVRAGADVHGARRG